MKYIEYKLIWHAINGEVLDCTVALKFKYCSTVQFVCVVHVECQQPGYLIRINADSHQSLKEQLIHTSTTRLQNTERILITLVN